MDRKHAVDHPIHDLIRRRWSPRAFSDRRVEPEKLLSLLEAARWSASSSNGQPWHYLVATKDNQDDYEKMFSCLVEGNQKWAKSAPVLMVSIASSTFAHNGKPNRHALHDTGAASALLTIEALTRGIYVHQMGGFLPDKVRELYSVPADAEPVAAIALGYPGDPAQLPDDLRARENTPSTRKPISEFVYSGVWKNKPGWVK